MSPLTHTPEATHFEDLKVLVDLDAVGDEDDTLPVDAVGGDVEAHQVPAGLQQLFEGQSALVSQPVVSQVHMSGHHVLL